VEFSQKDLAKNFVAESEMETEIQSILATSGLVKEEKEEDDLGNGYL
jgi:hypothetical protein